MEYAFLGIAQAIYVFLNFRKKSFLWQRFSVALFWNEDIDN